VVRGDKPLERNGWYQLAGTFDDAHLALYLDGRLLGRYACFGRTAPTAPLSVGADWSLCPVTFFAGTIGELKLLRTAEQAGK
jgi:hypothetical protein